MLVYYFVHVPGSVREVAEALSASAGDLSVWGRQAYRQGEDLRTKIEPTGWLPAKEIEVSIGTPRASATATTIPIMWKATGPEVLFPVLEGDLSIEQVSEDLTQITLRGSYRPPLGPIGMLIDRALLHRLAEACVKNLLDRIQDSLTPAAPSRL